MKKPLTFLCAVFFLIWISGVVGAAEAPPDTQGPSPSPPIHEDEDIENAIMPDIRKPQLPGHSFSLRRGFPPINFLL